MGEKTFWLEVRWNSARPAPQATTPNARPNAEIVQNDQNCVNLGLRNNLIRKTRLFIIRCELVKTRRHDFAPII